MKYAFTIAGADYVVDYSGKVTYEGAPARGPSYASGGEPAEGPEVEIIVDRNCLHYDNGSKTPLEMPSWLLETMTEAIENDDEAVSAIVAEHFERKAYEREQAEESRYDEARGR